MLEMKHLSHQVEGGSGEELGTLNDVSLTVADHQFMVITDPDGDGKTTLTKAIIGLMWLTGGAIAWSGTSITGLDITQRARLGVSYGFQQPSRFKGLRMRDLLALAAGSEKLTRGEGYQYPIRVSLYTAGYIDREAGTSPSSDKVKRIKIATILAHKSGLMILDGPETGVDLWSFARLTEAFRAIHQKREAALIVIPHREHIIGLADEIVMIRDEKIAKHGSKDEIFPQILTNTSAGCSYMPEGAR